MELGSQWLGVDDDGVLAVDVEDADLEQRSVARWPDQHDQVIIEEHSSHRVANGVPYVPVGDAVLSGWLANPHLDNIACLGRAARSALHLGRPRRAGRAASRLRRDLSPTALDSRRAHPSGHPESSEALFQIKQRYFGSALPKRPVCAVAPAHVALAGEAAQPSGLTLFPFQGGHGEPG